MFKLQFDLISRKIKNKYLGFFLVKLNDHKDLEDEPVPGQPKKILKPQKKQKVVSF